MLEPLQALIALERSTLFCYSVTDENNSTEKLDEVVGMCAESFLGEAAIRTATSPASEQAYEFVRCTHLAKMGKEAKSPKNNFPEELPEQAIKYLESHVDAPGLFPEEVAALGSLLADLKASLGAKVCISAEFHRFIQTVGYFQIFSDTDNKWIEDKRSRVGFAIDVSILDVDGNRVNLDRNFGAAGANSIDQKISETISVSEFADTIMRTSQAKMPSNNYSTVVFSPAAAGIVLHEVIGHGLEADMLQIFSSNYKRDMKIGIGTLTVEDNPTYENLFGSRNADDHGRISKPLKLIENGWIVGEYSNAGHEQNVWRMNYAAPAESRVSNLIVEPGNTSMEDLISCTRDGVLIIKAGEGAIDKEKGTFEIIVLEAMQIVSGRVGNNLLPFRLTGQLNWFWAGIAELSRETEITSMYCEKRKRVVPVAQISPGLLVHSRFETHPINE